jgi:hypothetical protein
MIDCDGVDAGSEPALWSQAPKQLQQSSRPISDVQLKLAS